MIEKGDTYSHEFLTYDTDGLPADAPDKSCTITPTATGIPVDVPLTDVSEGVYRIDYVTEQVGQHQGLFESTYGPQTFGFHVSDDEWLGVVSLDQAKQHLNKSGARQVDDEELRDTIMVASAWVEHQIGPVVPRIIIERVAPINGVLHLRAPVLELTSVVTMDGYPGGDYDPDDLDINWDNGTVVMVGFPFFYPVTATYEAGRVVVDPDIIDATLTYIRALWSSQRAGSQLRSVETLATGEFGATPGSAYFLLAAEAQRKLDLVPAVPGFG